jgi:hypothetical protein
MREVADLWYGWPLRLTLVGCEELRIWKKKWFRLKAATKANMAEAVSVEDLSKHEKEGQQRREEGERRERGCITQASTG